MKIAETLEAKSQEAGLWLERIITVWHKKRENCNFVVTGEAGVVG